MVFPDAALLVAHRHDLGRAVRGARLGFGDRPRWTPGQADFGAAVGVVSHARLQLGSMNRHSVRGGREMADIAAESNGYTRPCQETRNNVTSEFGGGPGWIAQRARVAIMSLKQRIPLLRWSVWRMATGARNITTTGQIGDGREAAAVEYVLQHARAGDIDDVMATIDRFAYEKSMLINVGDEKGALLDAAVRRADPEAGARARHLLRLRRAADRPGGSGRQGVLGRARRGQRRQRPPHLGACRRR